MAEPVILLAGPDPRALKDFFGELTSEVFDQLAIQDGAIVEYVSGVLAEFARSERLYRITDLAGKPIESLVEMLVGDTIAEQSGEAKHRDFRRYIGDFTLFMSGLFRDFVERHGSLDHYVAEGQRSYRRVAEVEARIASLEAPMYRDLAERFVYYSGALDFMRKTRFFRQEAALPLLTFAEEIARRMGTEMTMH